VSNSHLVGQDQRQIGLFCFIKKWKKPENFFLIIFSIVIFSLIKNLILHLQQLQMSFYTLQGKKQTERDIRITKLSINRFKEKCIWQMLDTDKFT